MLAPPGAGLPKLELLIARFLVGLRNRTGSRDSFLARFKQNRRAIRELIQSCPAGRASQRVLIKHCPGLEDSSRHWSVWMTLDHLRIVNLEIAGVIDSLAQGVPPEGEASTAAVKPSPIVGADVVEAYEKSCDTLLEIVAAHADLKTKLRFAHPWFGPMDAYEWFGMAGGHMGIHRVQLERILKGLENGTPPNGSLFLAD